jgi:hemoglobin/transferrin/lactoferrin receptor protein
MNKIYLCFILLLFHWEVYSQTLTVIDKTTRQPIPGVAIYTPDFSKSITTNSKGQALLSDFKIEDSLYLKHISYLTLKTTYRFISEKKFKIELSETDITLDEMVVSASRWEEKDKEIPYRIEKISMRDAKFQNPQTAADLLETGGYAYVQKSQLAGGSPMLRGFATNRVMLVIDGVRMNNAIFRGGNIQNVISIDANALEETEILFGPGAVMYGSDAIGGVMDFHTLKPKVSDTAKTIINGNAFARYSSANMEKTGHLDFNIGTKNLGFVTSFTYGDYDDLMAGSNGNSYFLRPNYQTVINGVDTTVSNPDPRKQIHSGFSQTNFMQKILLKTDSIEQIEYSFHYASTSNAPRYDRLLLDNNGDGNLDNAQWYYGPQKWMMHRLSYISETNNKVADMLRMTVAYQKFEESRHDRKTGSSRMRNQNETVHAISANVDLEKKLNEKINFYYGIELVENRVRSKADREDINTGVKSSENTRYPDKSIWSSYSAYFNMKCKLKPRLIFNAGLRFSYIDIQTKFDTALFPFPFTESRNRFGSLNGAAGIVFNATEKWNIYFNVSTGFRAPNIDDMGKVFDSEPGSVVVPNLNLKPEYAYNAELGTKKIFGNFLKLDLGVYFIYLDDALARRDFTFNGVDSIMYDGTMSRVQAIQNISNAYVFGFQGGAEIVLGRGFALKSVINFQHGRELNVDSSAYYPLSHAAPVFGNTHLTFLAKKIKMDLYANYNGKMDFDNLSYNDRIDDAPFAKDASGKPFVPAWYTLNFKIAYYVNKNLSLNAGVENITDVLYRPFASGISAPGRNFIFTLRGNF